MNQKHSNRKALTRLGAGTVAALLLSTATGQGQTTIDTNTGTGGVSGQIQQNGPTTFGGSQWHVKNSGSTSTTRKGLMRFDTNSLGGTVTAASLDLVVSLIDVNIADNDQTLNVYGLTDETQDGWDPGTLTWATAPGNNTASKFAGDPTETTLLGTIVLDFNGDKASPVGTVVSLSNTELINFLNADTNGQVTFLIGRVSGTGASLNLLFAGDTNASLAAPSLTVTTETDTTAPSIASLDPADDTLETLVSSNLTATFDEAIAAGTGNVTLKRVSDGTTVEAFDVATSPLLTISSSDLVIDPTSDLVPGEEYYIEIDATAIVDTSGNAFAGLAAPPADPNWSFTGDGTGPTLDSTSPVDDATNITISDNLVATFNEAIALGTTGSVTIINLTTPGSVSIELPGPDPDGTLSVSGNELTIDPAADLVAGDEYVIEITGDAIVDTSGNLFGGLLQTDTPNWSFTTDNTPPGNGSFGPAPDSTDVAIRDFLTLTLDEDVVVGTGNITIHLASDNSVVETIDVTGGLVTVNGGTVSIDPSVDLANSTSYYVNIEAGAFVDLSGNAYPGILDTTTWAFTTVAFDPTLLFADNFNRPNNADLNANSAGKSGSLGALDWSTGAQQSTIDILNNSLRINNDDSDGNDGAWAWPNHNFIGLTDFSVKMDITAQSSGGNGRYTGFRIGQSQADIAGEINTALGGNAADVQVYLDAVGSTRGVRIYEGGTDLGYVLSNPATTVGVLSATFTFADMNAGTTLNYEVFLDEVSVYVGSTTWSGTDENYISVQSNSTNNTLIDSFEVRSNSVSMGGLTLSIASSGGGLDFSWNGMAGMQYDLVSSTNPEAEPDPSAWAPYNDGVTTYENLLGNSVSGVAITDPKRFFAIREEPVGAIESWDFEADNGGFTTIGTPNDWAWGAPNSDNNIDLSVTAGNDGSTNCWATNLGAGGAPSGTIDIAADSILRSPNIDLSSVAGAELSFAAALDGFSGDTIEIRVRDADTDAILDTINPFALPLTANWTDYGPFTLAGAGETIYLEFRYLGNDASYIGLYLDDVEIAPTSP